MRALHPRKIAYTGHERMGAALLEILYQLENEAGGDDDEIKQISLRGPFIRTLQN